MFDFRFPRAHLLSVRTFMLGACLALCFSLSGCGGSGGSSTNNAMPQEMGSLTIGITDAPGDFIAYGVDVTALTLTRRNGDIITTLPRTTRIDFVELTDATEFLSVATVPVGDYDSVSLTLDFNNAEIVVKDDTGEPLVATAQDTEGNPLGSVVTQLNLTSTDIIRIRAGVPAAFSLDFDLDASNEVDLSAQPPVVTVEPFLLATAQLESDREHRLRGLLAEVDPNANTFTLNLRPFRQREGNFGALNIAVTDDTAYDINGEMFEGQEGLESLNGIAMNSPVVVHGRVDGTRFTADTVVAGTSLPGPNVDVLRGVVVARTDNTLTVRGASIERPDGSRIFRGTFTLLVDEDTRVNTVGKSQGGTTTLDLSVGQRIVAWGEITDDTTLSASRVRMLFSQLTAAVVQTDPLAVDLYWLNGRRPEIYDFTGTGMTSELDANPKFYEIDTAGLPLTNLATNDLVRIRGWTNTFGMAPPDFNAHTLIDLDSSSRAAQLWVNWPQASEQPFITVSDARLDVDLSQARQRLYVRGIPRDAEELNTEIALLAPESGQGVYAIKVRGSGETQIYRNFSDLTGALTRALDTGQLLKRVHTQGSYNNNSEEFIARRAGFVFIPNTSNE